MAIQFFRKCQFFYSLSHINAQFRVSAIFSFGNFFLLSLERHDLYLTFRFKTFAVFYVFTVTISILLNVLTIMWRIFVTYWIRTKRYRRVNLKEKKQNGREIHLYINKKQNGYQNVKETFIYLFVFRHCSISWFCVTWGPKHAFLEFIVHQLVYRKTQDWRHFAYLLL